MQAVMNHREQMIRNYIDAYNAFDVEGMVAGLDESIRFTNISGGIETLSLSGKAAFRLQAEAARHYFVSRKQTIRCFSHQEDRTEVAVDYHAILATDLPGGLEKGAALHLQGRSVFEFSGDRVTALTDIS